MLPVNTCSKAAPTLMSASVVQFGLLFRFPSMGSHRVSSSVRVSTWLVPPHPYCRCQRVGVSCLAPGCPGLPSPFCLSLRSPAGQERGWPPGVPTLFLNRTSTADSTGPGARRPGETGHGPPIASALWGSTLGKQRSSLRPPLTPRGRELPRTHRLPQAPAGHGPAPVTCRS